MMHVTFISFTALELVTYVDMVKSVEVSPKKKKQMCSTSGTERLEKSICNVRNFRWIKSDGFRHWKTAKGLRTLSLHYQNGGMDGICSVGTYTTHLSSLGFSKKRDYNYKKQQSLIRPHS